MCGCLPSWTPEIMELIAIIGQACLFPEAPDVDALWKNLLAGRDSIRTATEIDWLVDPHDFYDPRKGMPDRISNLSGGWLGAPRCELDGYLLPPEWLVGLDDLFIWPLHVSREALRSAGMWELDAARKRCGLVLGAYSWSLTRSTETLVGPLYDGEIETALRELLDRPDFTLAPRRPPRRAPHPLNAFIAGSTAMTLARALGLTGPRYAIDAACASMLYCLKLAALHLQSGHADTMLAAAVSASDPVFASFGFSNLQALPQQRSRPFDATSDGLAVAEGASAFVVRRLSDARRDGDPILAVIRGIGLGSDGAGQHIVTPNRKGQMLACERAYTEAGLGPADIDYVECHATGTALGDRSEIEVIAKLCEGVRTPRIGSLKSNLGHLLTAAGGAGLTKTVLAMQHGVIPATIGIREALRSADGRVGAEAIVRETTPWPDVSGRPRRAAINAFGFGGTNAHLIVEAPPESASALSGDPVRNNGRQSPPSDDRLTIIGMAGSFAGHQGLEALRAGFYEGRPSLTMPPEARFRGLKPENGSPPGGYIESIDIDLLRFRQPPQELRRLNPQQLLMLETADAALRDADLSPGGRVAVLVGMAHEPFVQRLQERWESGGRLRRSLEEGNVRLPGDDVTALVAAVADGLHPVPEPSDFLGYVGNLLASRVVALWDFSGPAFSVSAEENSVFRALQIAGMLLNEGEADAVVVAGVDLTGAAEHIELRARLTAPPAASGEMAFGFDGACSGWLPGEGAGAIVVTSRQAALRDNRRIYASISGIALADDPAACCVVSGRLTGPSAQSIATVGREALQKAGLAAGQIGYVEAFASGLEQEDRAEMAGLAMLFGEGGGSRGLGSAKAVVGHTMAASGIAAVLHAALALHERYIPPTLRWSGPKGPELDDAGFFVTPQPLPWLAPRSETRAALVTGLGLDGCSAALVLTEEADDRSAVAVSLPTTTCPLRVIPVHGFDPVDLVASIEELKRRLADGTDLSAMAAEAGCVAGQDSRPLACALVGSTAEQLAREATALIAVLPRTLESGKPWQSQQGSCFAPRPLGRSGQVAFVYSGMSGLTVGMGRDLFRLLPAAHHLMASCSDPREVLNASLLFPHCLLPAVLPPEEDNHARLQASALDLLKLGIILPTLSTALVRDRLGLEPDMTFGYSLGELSMMYAAGGWTLGDAQIDRLRDFPALSRLTGTKQAVRDHYGLAKGTVVQWESHVLLASPNDVLEAVKSRERVFLTQVNTPMEVVIAGEPAQCRAVIDAVGCEAVEIASPLVIHCAPAEAEFDGIVRLLGAPLGDKSNATPYFAANDEVAGSDQLPIVERIARGFCERLDFPRLIQRAYQDGSRIFVDVGPGASCARWISETLGNSPHVAVSVSQRGVPEAVSLARLEAALISHRVPMRKRDSVRAQKTTRTRIELGGLPLTAGLREPRLRERLRRSWQPCVALAGSASRRAPDGHAKTSASLASKTDALRAIVENSRSQAAAHQSLIELSERLFAPTGNVQAAPGRPVQKPRTNILDEAAVMEFAEGRLSNVFGPAWAPIDDYARRLRLPSPPFLALSRVTAMEGRPGTLGPAYIQTEFDIPNPAWYGVNGQAPYLALDAQ
jgi:PfaB family protein